MTIRRDKWSARRTLAFVVVASLALWSLIIGGASLVLRAIHG